MSSVAALTELLNQAAAEPLSPSSVWYFRKLPSKRPTRDFSAKAVHFVIVEQPLSLAAGAWAIAKSRSASMESMTRVRGSCVLYSEESVVLSALPTQGTFPNSLTMLKYHQARKNRATPEYTFRTESEIAGSWLF